jgi:sugar/nucleoside kinase (ribokinase family)
VDACIETLSAINPEIVLLVTDGPYGSYCYKNGYLEYTPVPAVKVIATAGAGDTFLAGTVAGLCCHLPLTKGRSDAVFSETPVTSAVELGTLLASLAVTSPDTIHQTADAALLYTFCKDHEVRLGSDFKKLFDSCMK